jgi:hypothetical protein
MLHAAVFGVATVLLTAGPSGCESRQDQTSMSKPAPETGFRHYSSTELKERLALVQRRYAEISREVEHKSGLTMGVSIRDDRALLGELYREAHEIERELARRGEATALGDQVRRLP